MYFCRTELDPENPAHEQYAASLLTMLVQELQARASGLAAEEHFITKIKLIDAASNLQVSFNFHSKILLK